MVFSTHNYGDLIVTEYVNSRNVCVKFVETGYETFATIGNIRNGNIKDRLQPTVCGVGIVGNESSEVDGVRLKEYDLWLAMIHRCYGKKSHNSSYKDCSVSENFKYYPYFKEWCNKQVGFNQDGWCLDKDILIKGNRIYSEHVCVFVPNEVNLLTVKCDNKRGEYVIGTSYRKKYKKFAANLSIGGKQTHIGHFDTELEAFMAYKNEKETYIIETVTKWKDQIDPRVYEALLNYQVEITD